MNCGRIIMGALDRKGLRFLSVCLLNLRARSEGKGVTKIFRDQDDWIHQTSWGYFAYHKPLVGLDMRRIEELARMHFLWGYEPKDGDVVVDVGAGVGEETLLFSHEVGKRGRVISIEAHPGTYRRLKKLVELNRLENVATVQLAVVGACQEGAAVRILDSSDYLSNRVNDSGGIPVQAGTVDTVCASFGLSRINFLKMNIEGAESFAIEGMTDTLKRTEVLCVCCHDFLASVTGDEFFRTKRTVLRILVQCGLRVVERTGEGLPSYVQNQVWALNPALVDRFAHESPDGEITAAPAPCRNAQKTLSHRAI